MASELETYCQASFYHYLTHTYSEQTIVWAEPRQKAAQFLLRIGLRLYDIYVLNLVALDNDTLATALARSVARALVNHNAGFDALLLLPHEYIDLGFADYQEALNSRVTVPAAVKAIFLVQSAQQGRILYDAGFPLAL